MSQEKHICPVCGYDRLIDEPYDQCKQPSYEICFCCGFEFGVDGARARDRYIVFRNQWIQRGAPWFIPELKPADWSLEAQLVNLKKNTH